MIVNVLFQFLFLPKQTISPEGLKTNHLKEEAEFVRFHPSHHLHLFRYTIHLNDVQFNR